MGRDRKSSILGAFGSSKSGEDIPPMDIHLVGLLNLGNSCFYNTIIQALASSLPLADTIEDPPSSSPTLQHISPSSSSYNADTSSLPTPLPVSLALISTLAKLKEQAKKDPKAFNPKVLLRELANKHEEYLEASQQDSHELLVHLLDAVVMEEVDLIKKVCEQPPLEQVANRKKRKRAMTLRANGHSLPVEDDLADGDDEADGDDDESDDEETEALVKPAEATEAESSDSSDSDSSDSDTSDEDGETQKSRTREARERERKSKRARAKMRPFIDSVFGGKLASVVICEECKNVSLTREDFLDLSLSLKDDAAKMRKRDRIRRSLQAGFFSKRESIKESPTRSPPAAVPPLTRPSIRRENTSLSEAEASASPSGSEIESDGGEDGFLRGATVSRRKSLDPGQLREAGRPAWASASASNPNSRSSSPLGRALTMMSGASRSSRRTKGKIPKPTSEQLAYIRKVLADIPGPPPTPLPSQIRWSRPPGSGSSSERSSMDSTSSSAASFSHLSIQMAAESANTDLYECLQQFTAVETLEGENSFACKNCWKLLNPDLVERRRREKLERGRTRTLKAALASAEKSRNGSPVNLGVSTITETPSEMEETHFSGDEATPTTSVADGPVSIMSDSNNKSVDSGFGHQLLGSDSTGGDAQLADVEDFGSISDGSIDSAVKDLPPAKPLTTANVEALDVPDSNEAVRSPTPASATSREGQSGASLSTRPSATSMSTNVSRRINPPRQDRHILRKAHKRYLISANDLPPVLVIHFKRFTQTSKAPLFGTSFVNLKKRDDTLTFPQHLDMSPFLAPVEKPPKSSTTRRSARDSRHHSQSSEKSAPPPPANYRLCAVIEHIGNMAGGHYVAYVLSDRYALKKASHSEKETTPPRRWFYTSDDHVRACTVEEVMKSKAYMLFYERMDLHSSGAATAKSRM